MTYDSANLGGKASIPNPMPSNEVRALTGLRGVAALDVMIGHYDIHNIPFIHAFVFNDPAVDIFFCLSSFTLCLVYLGGDEKFDFYDFFVARFARIYPLFLLTTAACVYIGFSWHGYFFPILSTGFIIQHTLAQLLLVAALPIKSLSGSWNSAAWSVSVEAVCYVTLFPLIVACWPKLRRASPRFLLLAMFSFALFDHVIYVRDYNSLVDGIGYPPPSNGSAYWVALARGATMFASGAIGFAIFKENRELRHAAGLMTDTAALLIIAIIAGETTGFINRHTLVVLAPLLIMGLMDGRSITARLLASPPLHFLGVISYSIYLLHLPIYGIVTHLFPAIVRSDTTRILIPFIVTLVFSAISYYFFEAPARRLIRRLMVTGYREPLTTLRLSGN